MTPEQLHLKSEIQKAKHIKNLADRQYYFLVSKCNHVFEKHEDAISCSICRQWGCEEDLNKEVV